MGFEALLRDIRHAIRFCLGSPGFTIAAVVTLALGIGANTVMFSVIKAVLLQPLPYGAADRLAIIWKPADADEMTHLSLAEIVSYGNEAQTLERMDGYSESNANLTGSDEPERVRSASVTAGLFETLQTSALIGRTFTAAEGIPGGERVVLLGENLWRRRFGGEPDIVGRSIPVNGRPRIVIGVMPASFRLPLDYRTERPTELWMPLQLDRAKPGPWGSRSYFGIARLRPNASVSAAEAEFAAIARGWIRAGFVADQGDGRLMRSAIPLKDFVNGPVRHVLVVLLGAVGCLLLIACANVTNLLLAKGDVRRREVAIRTAIGASRAQIGRQLLVESVLLAFAGGVVALGLAHVGLRVLVSVAPANVPQAAQATLDGPVLLFALALAIATGLIFGLLPAVRASRSDVTSVLADGSGSRSSSPAMLQMRRALVIAQLTGSIVLVIAAGLLVRSLIALQKVDLGFDPRNLLTAHLQLPPATYTDSPSVIAFYRELRQRLEQLPEVEHAGAVRVLPLARKIGDWSITLEGRPHIREENPNGDYQWVTPGYFEAMNIRLLRGRLLTDADSETAPLVVVINQTMAERYWPGESGLGKRFRMGGDSSTQPHMTIIGIVGNTRHNSVTEAPRAEMFLPHAQLERSIGGASGWPMSIVIKTSVDPLTVAPSLRSIVWSMDRNLPVSEIRTMERIAADALAPARFASTLLGVLASLALVLAAIGVYSTISLLVAERAREIGIRVALGARRADIWKLVLGEGLTLAVAGGVLGLVAAWPLMRLLSSLVYGVGILDPFTFTVVPALLTAVSLLASLIPARRAVSVEPVVTLRAN